MCFAVLCCFDVARCFALGCDVLCGVVLGCAVLCCVVWCGMVWCCVVLRGVVVSVYLMVCLFVVLFFCLLFFVCFWRYAVLLFCLVPALAGWGKFSILVPCPFLAGLASPGGVGQTPSSGLPLCSLMCGSLFVSSFVCLFVWLSVPSFPFLCCFGLRFWPH